MIAMKGVDVVAATYQREEEDDNESLPDIGDIVDSDAEDDVDESEIENAQPQLDKLRQEFRDVLHSMKSASYDAPLDVLQSAMVSIEPVRILMEETMLGDLAHHRGSRLAPQVAAASMPAGVYVRANMTDMQALFLFPVCTQDHSNCASYAVQPVTQLPVDSTMFVHPL
jgi:hypothetical protein